MHWGRDGAGLGKRRMLSRVLAILCGTALIKPSRLSSPSSLAMSVLSSIPYAAALFLESAQVTAQFTPVPWLAPAIGLVNTLISMFRQAHANKWATSHLLFSRSLTPFRYALKQLQDRCISFLVVVQKKGEGVPPPEQQRLVAGVQRFFSTCSAHLSVLMTGFQHSPQYH